MRAMKLILPAAVLMTGFLVCTTSSYGTQAYAKKEGNKPCTFCHGKIEAKDAMSKNLNDAGNYYKTHDHKLDGYVPKK